MRRAIQGWLSENKIFERITKMPGNLPALWRGEKYVSIPSQKKWEGLNPTTWRTLSGISGIHGMLGWFSVGDVWKLKIQQETSWMMGVGKYVFFVGHIDPGRFPRW